MNKIESISPFESIKSVLAGMKAGANFAAKVKIDNGVVQVGNDRLSLSSKDVYIFTLGKTAFEQSLALRAIASEAGLTVKKTFAVSKDETLPSEPGTWLHGNHPISGEQSFLAYEKAVDFLASAPAEACLWVGLSGGGSALLEKTVLNWSPEQKDILSDILLCGWDIRRINFLRKLLSESKNSGLAQFTKVEQIIQFIDADVPFQAEKNVASSPFYFSELNPDEIYRDICVSDKLSKHSTWFDDNLSELTSYQAQLKAQNRNEDVCSFVVSDGDDLEARLHHEFFQQGWSVSNFTPKASNNFSSLVDSFEEAAEFLKPGELLYSIGEAQVKVKEVGNGGRNSHFVATLGARLFENDLNKGINLMSVATDGGDAQAPYMGARLDFHSYTKAKESGVQIQDYLKDFRSYDYFEKLNLCLPAIGTGVNLMDIRILYRDLTTPGTQTYET